MAVAWSSTRPAAGSRSPRTPTPPAGPTEGRLTPGEIGLLAALARRPGAVLTRDQLLEAVTRRPDEVYDRVIDVHVANLRRKLGDDAAQPWLIETIPQTGYRLVAAPDAGMTAAAEVAEDAADRPAHPARRRSLAWRLGLLLGVAVLGVLLLVGIVVNRVVSGSFETVLTAQQQQRLDDAAVTLSDRLARPAGLARAQALVTRIATSLGGEIRVVEPRWDDARRVRPDAGRRLVPGTRSRSRATAGPSRRSRRRSRRARATVGSCRCSTSRC